jgi:hypothetical protein
MTTFLTIGIEYRGEEVVLPYCSPSCRIGCSVIEVSHASAVVNPRHLDLSSYDFEETCSLCGVTIPAAVITPADYDNFAREVSNWIGEIDVFIPASERELCPSLPSVIRGRVGRVYRGDCFGGDTYEVSLPGFALIVPLSWVELVIDDLDDHDDRDYAKSERQLGA